MQAREIAVIGAGMGGLAAASLLARDGHRVTLVERFASPRALGSGLVVQPVGLAVLDALGVGDAARALGGVMRAMIGHAEGKGARPRKVLDVSYPAARPGLAMHRASLFHVLWQAMLASDIQRITGAEVIAAPRVAGRRQVITTDGPLGAFDLVIDASGAGSRLSPLRARTLGFGAVWGSVPWPETDLAPDMLCQRYRRADRMAGIMPIGRLPDDPTPRAGVFWSLPRARLASWPQVDFAAWKAEVSAFWPEMGHFLAPMTTAEAMTPASYSHGSLRRPYDDELIFIGDAAHRASPQLGQGANMALLDAMAVAEALRQHPIDDAGAAYARMRKWHVRIYQLFSAALTPAYQSQSRALPVLRDLVLAPMSQLPPVPQMLTRLVTGDLLPPLAGSRWLDKAGP